MIETVTMTAAQGERLMAWAAVDDDFAPLEIADTDPGFDSDWCEGDVVIVQGDAHLQLSRADAIKEVVPPHLFPVDRATAS